MKNAKEIINIVSLICNVSVRDIMSTTRTQDIVEARQICQYFIRSKNQTRNAMRKTGISNSEISSLWNQRPCTMIHSYKTVRNLIETDKIYRSKIEKIFESVNVF